MSTILPGPDPLETARFVARPNRFLLILESPTRGRVRAFLPNPGRLRELLLPGVKVYITPAQAGGTNRRTRYTAVAVERDNAPIFLHTHATNTVARRLLESQRLPGLERTRIVRAEVPHGHSRFDFLLREDEREFFLEVKSVTLFGNRVAMFPDAVTDRGRRHLLELAALSRPQAPHAVLFLVHTPSVDWFLPDYHTDLAFSQTLLQVRERVRILPMAVDYDKRLALRPQVKGLTIPWAFLEEEAQDRGAYLLLLHLKHRRRVAVGALGPLAFARGWYIYVGSAMRGLSARVNRHLRKRKTLKWHIDYLRQVADAVEALPVRSSRREECEIVDALSQAFTPGPPEFGCSDCRCTTHLFHSPLDPQSIPVFHEVLQRFRMRRPAVQTQRGRVR